MGTIPCESIPLATWTKTIVPVDMIYVPYGRVFLLLLLLVKSLYCGRDSDKLCHMRTLSLYIAQYKEKKQAE